MKKKTNILLAVLILLCAAGFTGYRMLQSIRTDSNAPQIHLSGTAPEVSVTAPAEALLQGITATDREDGDVTGSLVVESVRILDKDGRISVSYAAFDKAGNVAKAQQEARYTDYESPRFSLSAPLLYRYGTSFDVLSTMEATDMLDGDIQHRIRATVLDDEGLSVMGSHNVQFQVTNSLGDTVTLTVPVEVYDAQLYTATLSLNSYLVYLHAGDSFRPQDYLHSFTLAGETTRLNGRVPADFSLHTVGSVRTDTPGVYTLNYLLSYTEQSDNPAVASRKYTGYSKLIVVVEE